MVLATHTMAGEFAVTDVRTTRLQLHAIDVAEGQRIVARMASPGDSWASDFPFEGDVGAVGGFLRATAASGDQRPFGYYLITRLADGRAIGGIGFKGQPVDGCVEIGYGLTPSARGGGYAAEAAVALLALATEHGLSRVIADTTLDNIASQRTLIRAGFRLVSADDELHHYEALLDPDLGTGVGPRPCPVGSSGRNLNDGHGVAVGVEHGRLASTTDRLQRAGPMPRLESSAKVASRSATERATKPFPGTRGVDDDVEPRRLGHPPHHLVRGDLDVGDSSEDALEEVPAG